MSSLPQKWSWFLLIRGVDRACWEYPSDFVRLKEQQRTSGMFWYAFDMWGGRERGRGGRERGREGEGEGGREGEGEGVREREEK